MKNGLLSLIFAFLSVTAVAAPLPANAVFDINLKPIDPNTFSINWQIKPGYFLYADRIKLDEQANTNFELGSLRLPKPLLKTDRLGRTWQIYRNSLSIPIAILGKQPGEAILEVHYQGCADDGFCYPPETRSVKVSIDKNLALASVSFEPLQQEPILDEGSSVLQNKEGSIENIFTRSSTFMVIISFFGFGLLLAFTPCVLPMVPVLSGIIIGHGHAISTRKAFFLSLSYVLSMSLTYALVGAVVAVLGSNLQIIMQAPWVIGLFSLLFVLLALSMFGFYELKLPVSWQQQLSKASRSQSSGHYLGAAIMGCLSTLILSPCVTAPLIGALSYIAQTGNVLFGSLTLFFLGLGMGTPLLLIGTSAGKWLPHTGIWMNSVKNFFGVLLLGVAIYLLGRLLPPPITMILWASLLVFTGIFAGALSRAQTNPDKLHQSAGIILLAYGLLVLAGASLGNDDPLQPLAGVFSKATAANRAGETIIKTEDELTAVIQNADKPVMVDFYADWCTSCKILESTVLNNPEIKKALKKWVVVKVDLTANNAEDKKIMKTHQVIAPPTFLFFKNREELPTLRLVGEVSKETFLKTLESVASDN